MKHISAGTAAAALTVLSGMASAQDAKMSQVRPRDTAVDVELSVFAEQVLEATDGHLNIKQFSASAHGD